MSTVEERWDKLSRRMARLIEGYEGDEPYPDDDHSLGEHEGAAAEYPECKECRKKVNRGKD